ncbi:WXG100 family type VII secretion target [Micromonospora sp. DT233]|uniref:WXG100 family type VII secretion target n=1 Tax=Micromonospora sp. DT233 TaxID=3393432 RepID=UPI003CF11DB0
MSDEYVQRYQPVSHEQLYQGVQAGRPEQIDTLAAEWSSLKDTVDELGRALRKDLSALRQSWVSDAGDEFQQRVSLVVQYSGSLAKGMGAVHQGLSLMSGPLRSAKKEAESPDETDDHDKAIGGAAAGSLLGPVGAVVGGIAGHQQDEEEKEKAHQRMVKVVAELAASYDVSAFDRWVPPEPPPPGTPGGVSDDSAAPQGGPGANAPGKLPGGGAPAHTGTSGIDKPTGGIHASFIEDEPLGEPVEQHFADPIPTTDSGTSLAGTGALGAGTLLGGWAAGAGGVVASAARGGKTASASPKSGFSTAVPIGGVLGTAALAAGAGGSGSAPVGRPAAAGAGMDGRAATSTSRVDANRPGAGDRSAAGGRSAGGRPGAAGTMRPGVLGGGAPGHGAADDETASRSTWLTEDDMDWKAGAADTPPVLDGR